MSYKLIYTKTSVKDIKKLDTVTRKRLGKKLKKYSKTPMKYARKLTDPRIGTYRWRVGSYRVIFDLDGKNIVILRVRHRREVYK